MQIRKSISGNGNVKYIPSVCADSTTSIINLNMRGSTPRRSIRHCGDRACAMSKATSVIQERVLATPISEMCVQSDVRPETFPHNHSTCSARRYNAIVESSRQCLVESRQCLVESPRSSLAMMKHYPGNKKAAQTSMKPSHQQKHIR